MYFHYACATVAGLASLAMAAPAPAPLMERPVEVEKRDITIPIIQQIQETNIVVVEQNLGAISQLVQIAEQQFAARIQAELALITQAETIKNNIRVNHFKSLFSTVNTVIVTVTNVQDVRNSSNVNTRYLINQQLADNGFPQSQIAVMVTAAETMTISAAPTNAPELNSIIQNIAASGTGKPSVQAYNASLPFGQIGQSVLLPFGTQAPKSPLTLADPAAIILKGQKLFVQNSQTFVSDCSLFASQGNTFINSQISILTTLQQIAAQQASGLILGSGLGGNLITNATEPEAAPAAGKATSTTTEKAKTATEKATTATQKATTSAQNVTTSALGTTTTDQKATPAAQKAATTA